METWSDNDVHLLLEDWLSRIQTKPDTELLPGLVTGFGPLWETVVVSRRLPDSRAGINDDLARYADQSHFITIGAIWDVPQGFLERADFDGFVRWVRKNLIDLEIHELDEWLKVDGVRRFDPHQKEQR
jgi:hypothetical protein